MVLNQLFATITMNQHTERYLHVRLQLIGEVTSAEPVSQSASAHGRESTAGLECVCAEIDDVSAGILSGIRCLAVRSLSTVRLARGNVQLL